jgi:NDP-sugar pyrophosphorylase family protein
MKALLICPGAPPALRSLSETTPLACVPFFGQGIIEYWLSHFAATGIREVLILSHDRTGEVEKVVGDGRRWGLKAQFSEESRELTRAQALTKYEQEIGTPDPQTRIALMDRFPGQAGPLFTSFPLLYSGLTDWMPKAKMPDRVGINEVKPGVWIGLNAQVPPDLQIESPCWIGKNVYIGAGTLLRSGTIIEDGVFLEGASSLSQSWIGPHTFVGKCSELARSLALGSTLINIDSGLSVQVPDCFVLCALRHPQAKQAAGLFARLVEMYCRSKAEAEVFWKHLLINRGS